MQRLPFFRHGLTHTHTHKEKTESETVKCYPFPPFPINNLLCPVKQRRLNRYRTDFILCLSAGLWQVLHNSPVCRIWSFPCSVSLWPLILNKQEQQKKHKHTHMHTAGKNEEYEKKKGEKRPDQETLKTPPKKPRKIQYKTKQNKNSTVPYHSKTMGN